VFNKLGKSKCIHIPYSPRSDQATSRRSFDRKTTWYKYNIRYKNTLRLT